jgi:transposase-like protein
MTRKPGFLNERDRAMLRATLAFPGTAPAVFTNENVRGLLGADKTCMTCPRCGSAVPGEGGKLCQEYRCDECSYALAKST